MVAELIVNIFFSFVFQNMSYYKISHVDGRVTNPEQRIASDIPRFCSELSELVQDDLTAVVDGLLYTWRLCSYASPKYVLWILVISFNFLDSLSFDNAFHCRVQSIFFLTQVVKLKKDATL